MKSSPAGQGDEQLVERHLLPVHRHLQVQVEPVRRVGPRHGRDLQTGADSVTPVVQDVALPRRPRPRWTVQLAAAPARRTRRRPGRPARSAAGRSGKLQGRRCRRLARRRRSRMLRGLDRGRRAGYALAAPRPRRRRTVQSSRPGGRAGSPQSAPAAGSTELGSRTEPSAEVSATFCRSWTANSARNRASSAAGTVSAASIDDQLPQLAADASVSRATTSSSVPASPGRSQNRPWAGSPSTPDRGQRQLLVAQRHPRAELQPVRRPPDVQADRGRPRRPGSGPSSGFAVIMVRPERRRLVEQPPETAADRAQGQPRAARQGVPGAGTGRRPELQQQLAMLGHVRAGDEIEVVPADARSDPVAGLAQSGRPDPQILAARRSRGTPGSARPRTPARAGRCRPREPGYPAISLSSAFSHSGRSTSWAAAARCRATTSTAAACLQSWADRAAALAAVRGDRTRSGNWPGGP